MFRIIQEENRIILKIFFINIRISKDIGRLFIKPLKPIISLLDYIIPKQDKKIACFLFDKHESKTFVFTDYIEQHYPNEYKIVYINTTGKNKRLKEYKFYDLRALYHIYSSKYIIITHCDYRIGFLKSKKRTYINLFHGMPIKKIAFTKETSKSTQKHYNFVSENFKCFASSDIFKSILVSCFMVPYNNIFITGLPITDRIMDNTNNAIVNEFFNFNKYKKVIFYLPTFKTKGTDLKPQINTEYNNIFYFDNFNNKEFTNFLEQNEYLFIMKPHPLDEEFYKSNLNSIPQSNNFKIIFDQDLKENNFDLYDMFKFTDLMISDFSSVTLDYLILNRPVIYLDNLTEEYSENRGMILPDNYPIFMPGHQVKTYQELKEKIIKSLTEDDTKELRERTLPLIHKYRDDKASERIFKIMTGLEK